MTPARISRFARDQSLEVQLNAGTFFLRWSGLFFENFRIWIRANLLWGAAFPSLGGELYFAPAQTDAHDAQMPTDVAAVANAGSNELETVSTDCSQRAILPA